MIDYVHANPVRKGLVAEAGEWKWSSAGWYAGGEPNTLRPDPLDWGGLGLEVTPSRPSNAAWPGSKTPADCHWPHPSR